MVPVNFNWPAGVLLFASYPRKPYNIGHRGTAYDEFSVVCIYFYKKLSFRPLIKSECNPLLQHFPCEFVHDSVSGSLWKAPGHTFEGPPSIPLWSFPTMTSNRRRRGSQDKMAGWHHRCNGHELGQSRGDGEIERSGLLQSMSENKRETVVKTRASHSWITWKMFFPVKTLREDFGFLGIGLDWLMVSQISFLVSCRRSLVLMHLSWLKDPHWSLGCPC